MALLLWFACLLALVGMLRLDGPVASLNIARSSGFDDELTEPQLLSAGAGFDDEYQPPSSRCAQRAAATRTHTQHTQRKQHPLSPVTMYRACVRVCVCNLCSARASKREASRWNFDEEDAYAYTPNPDGDE